MTHSAYVCEQNMDKDSSKKVILVSFVIAGFLAALTTTVILETAAAAFGEIARLYAQDVVKHGLPVVAGLATFFYLQFNKSVRAWAEEVVVEVGKVVWPSRQNTVAVTTAVCIMVGISGFILWAFDFLSSSVVKAILNF